MTEMLQSIKSDLLSRRLLPALVVLCVVLVAAVAYTVAGGSSSGSPSSSPSSGVAAASGRALTVVVASADPNEAVSETPSGTKYQNKSPVRDPFIPLPSAPNAQTASSTAPAGKASESPSSGASTPSSGSTSSGSGSSGGSAPTPKPSKTSKPAAPQSAYTVTALFGLAPAAPTDAPKLTSYANLKPQAPLPSKQDVRIVFERVSTSGTGAIFKLVLPPILHGQGQCLPNTSECEAVELAVGQTEELEYVEASGQVAVYQLKVVSIAKNSASASAARVARTAAAKVARKPFAHTSLRSPRHSGGDSAAHPRSKITR